MRTQHARRAVVLVAACAFLAACNKKVPDLVGKSREEAQEMLEKAKLEIGDVKEVKGKGDPGAVVEQAPKAGSKAPESKKVALVIEAGGGSAGAEDPVKVPRLTGSELAEAEAALLAAGLLRGNVQMVINDKPAGKVFDQDPPPETEVAPGTAVDLRIASDAMLAVPPVAGQAQAAAEQMLREKGLAVGTISYEIKPDSAPAGSVVEANPDAGTMVAKGTPVKLTIKQASVVVPRVIGMSSEKAQLKLFQAGLQPAVKAVLDRKSRAGTVTWQSAPEDVRVARNSTVGMKVAYPRLSSASRAIMLYSRPGIPRVGTQEEARKIFK